DRALEMIQELEPFERGLYGGPVGWFDRNGDGRFAVAIRSARVHGRDASLFAGAGLVNNSKPESEWDEVQWKYHSLLNLLQNK
ncbi:MAG: chorismate-binding protein, partial [bacterium]